MFHTSCRPERRLKRRNSHVWPERRLRPQPMPVQVFQVLILAEILCSARQLRRTRCELREWLVWKAQQGTLLAIMLKAFRCVLQLRQQKPRRLSCLAAMQSDIMSRLHVPHVRTMLHCYPCFKARLLPAFAAILPGRTAAGGRFLRFIICHRRIIWIGCRNLPTILEHDNLNLL